MDGPSGPLMGTIRSWREPWGFVICPNAFQGDLFAHRQHFLGGGPPGDLTGATVQFERAIDQKGRPHATTVSVLQGGAQGMAAPAPTGRPFQTFAAAPPVRRPPPAPMAMVAQAPAGRQGTGADKVAHLVGSRLRGEIRSWKQDWGFVVSPAFQGDLFVHRMSLQLSEEPAPGKKVGFTVAIDQRGRASAAEVTDASPGPEDFAGQGLLSGQIRSWKRDWGFIVAPSSFEGDLFCHVGSLQLDSPDTSVLDQVLPNRNVTFEVSIDKRGRPCASQVMVVDADFPAVLHSASAARQTQVALAPPPPAPTPAPSMADGAGPLIICTIRSWREPWGFAVAPEHFQGDLFVHKEAFLAPAPAADLTGYQVQLRRAMDSRGRPCAREVTVLGPGDGSVPVHAPTRMPQAAMLPPPAPAAPSAGYGASQDGKFNHLVGQQMQGQVRSWKNDWGFIVAPERFEGDLFVHKGQLLNGAPYLAPGARVTFEVGIDQRGRTTAMNVQCHSSPEEWAGSGARLTGQIRSWKEPWGFLVSPSFVGDLFFHILYQGQSMPPGYVAVGAEVSFKVERDSKGRCTAMEMAPAAPMQPMHMQPIMPMQEKRGPAGFQQPSAKRQRF